MHGRSTADVIQLRENSATSAYGAYLAACEEERSIEQELATAQTKAAEASKAYLTAPMVATVPPALLQAQSESQRRRQDAERQLKAALADHAQALQIFEDAKAIFTEATRKAQEAEQLVTGIEREMTHVFLQIESASLEAEQSRKDSIHKLVALKEEAVRKERSLADASLRVMTLRREALQSITKETINTLDAAGLSGLRQSLAVKSHGGAPNAGKN